MMVDQETTLWALLTVVDGDILNVRTMTAYRERALESMINNAENDIDETNRWYKLVRFRYVGEYAEVGRTLCIVLNYDGTGDTLFEDLKVYGIYDSEQDIPNEVRDRDGDFWIDTITLV